MLDEEHECLPQELDDPNIYTLGRIGEHNVVIACLPAGRMGTHSAATVAVHMKTRFNAIRFGLMVGIGGGVPSDEHDVQLGDVVVSQPYMEHGGVIQYDFGKTAPSGFVRTGFLNAPPTILLNAVASLRANHLRKRGSLLGHLSKLSHLPEFAPDNTGPDNLYEATYEHVGGTACEQCSKGRIITRQSRSSLEVMVHYGTVASGSQVMRDGVVRDKVSLSLGGALCFEMEAAGLMNSFPCLLIRGICDYADSHKNKRWQGYAAGTAAAYAKEVLSKIPATTLVMEPTVDEVMGGNASRKTCWTVPFERNPRFVSRSSHLDQLMNTIFELDQPSTLAITGLGGVGKTQIALELAYRIREKYPECSIFWMSATGIQSLQEAYLDVGQQLGIHGLQEEKADIKKLVQSHLSQEIAGQWLLIFDNVDDMDIWTNKSGNKSEPHGLKYYLPRSHQGRVIFTTRNRKIAVKLAQSNVIEVSAMDEEVATQLLSKSLINKELLTNRQNTQKLLQQLTFLPLAIVQAAAYINENGITLSDYLVLLEQQEQDVVDLLSEDFEDEGRYQDIKNSVATTWLISFEHIRRLDPLAVEYLSFMSCLDPKDIPQSLLPPAESRKKEMDAIGTLSAYSFISRRPASQVLDIHRLVHLAMRNWLRMEESLAQWTVKAMKRLEEVFPDHDHENRIVWRAYLAHARYVLDYDSTKEDMQQRTKLLWKFAMCLFSDGKYNEADEPFSQVMETYKKMLGSEHPETLISMGNLASTYANQGRWKEAEELGVQVMETRKTVLGSEHLDTLTSIANLASTYANQGRWKEAEELEVQVIEARKRLFGSEHPSTLISISNLASTNRKQGRWKEAEELLMQVIEAAKRVLGSEHLDTLTSMGNLASTYANQGRWKEAEELGVQVMEVRKRVLSLEHPSTLTSMGNLALTYANQGRWKEAEELEVQVMEVRKRVLGLEHPSTLTSMSKLALAYANQGQWKEAEELEVQVMEARKRAFGLEHPSTLISMGNLASTYANQGRWKEAKELEVQVMETRKTVLGSEHPDTLASLLVQYARFHQGWRVSFKAETQSPNMNIKSHMQNVNILNEDAGVNFD